MAISIFRWQCLIPQILQKLGQGSKFVALKPIRQDIWAYCSCEGDFVVDCLKQDCYGDVPQEAELRYRTERIDMPFFCNDESFSLVRLDGIGWLAESSEELLSRLGLSITQKDEESVLFEYYEKNWPQYYGSTATFSLSTALDLEPTVELLTQNSRELPFPMQDGKGRQSPYGFFKANRLRLERNCDFWREWDLCALRHTVVCAKRNTKEESNRVKSQLLMQQSLARIQSTYTDMHPWKS